MAQFVIQARDGKTEFIRPWAGITAQSVDQALSEGLGLVRPEGVVVSRINPDSPFAKVGVSVGDVVLKVDGQPVNTPAEMLFRMSLRALGDVAAFEIIQGDETLVKNVGMVAPPQIDTSNILQMPEGAALAGLAVAVATPAILNELWLPPTLRGVIVLNPGPNAGSVGLRIGDILNAINNMDIVTAQDVPKALEKSSRRVKVEAMRGSQRITLRFGL